MQIRYCELCGNTRKSIYDYGPCSRCQSRLSKVWDIPMGESGNRYCQGCGEARFQQDTDKPQPCLKCSGVNFDRKPKPHVGVIRCYYLTDEDKIFLKVQRIKVEEETYGNGAGTDGSGNKPRGW